MFQVGGDATPPSSSAGMVRSLVKEVSLKSKKQKRIEALERWQKRLLKCTALESTDGKGTMFNGEQWAHWRKIATEQIKRLRVILGPSAPTEG